MILMQLNNISKSFAGNVILNGVNFEVKKNDRIAIVGRNGAGKSTLLKIITGELRYDAGDAFIHRDVQIGYLAQHNDLHSERTIYDEMLTVFEHLIEEEKEIVALTKKIEQLAIDGIHDEKLLLSYSEKLEQFEQNGGYRYESDIKGVLLGLGFSEEDFVLTINDLSGGQKTRLALGKLLLHEYPLLILDEPTNHLDIETLTWLENYLLTYPGAIVVVSHDRYFLDKIITTVYEITYKTSFKYYGNYSNFLEMKAKNYERDLKAYVKEQQEIRAMEVFIQRNIARASTTKRAQSRKKQLEKMPKTERPLGDEATASFSFEVAKSSGNDVLQVNDFSYTYTGASEPLFANVSFSIYKGERIALIGENGVGKTTLLKEILNENPLFRFGSNVQIGYYDQEQTNLTSTNTLIEEIWNDFPNETEQKIRTVLGNFLFSGDDVLKYVHTLSGGEKARLALAKLMLKKANFLILDEPTNHLDLVSKEILELALQDFEGTILFVSHDRYFINKITDKVFELTKDGLTTYLGDYDYFLYKKAEATELNKLNKDSNQDKKLVETEQELSFKEQKRLQSIQRKKERDIKEVEGNIEQLELQLEEKELLMTDPLVYNNHEKLLQLTTEVNDIKQMIEQLMARWEQLHE